MDSPLISRETKYSRLSLAVEIIIIKIKTKIKKG